MSYLSSHSEAAPRQHGWGGKSAWRVALSSPPGRPPHEPAAEPGPPHLLSYFFFYVLLRRLYSISISIFGFYRVCFCFNPF